jgi:hypothetical protein
MTPRRILLLMGGLFAFGAVYAIYARAFGWLDGLPVLKESMLERAEPQFLPPARPSSPTIDRLKQAYGENAPETEPAFYPFQLQFRNGDTSLVLASGSPPSSPNSKRVTLSPFSIAIFSKPKPPHLLQPGEVNEITTFHADKAVLEFDRKIETPADMNTAKLIRLELISDPEQAIPDPLKRRGLIHVTNNQRSGDPNRFLVLKTAGPMFYRDPKFAEGPEKLGPDVWTDSPIEIVDRSNLPLKPGAAAAVAATASEESRNSSVIDAILSGQRLPPPTVTALGMRIYLDPDEDQNSPKPLPKAQPKARQTKRGAAGYSGVRRVELLEKVLLHLWVEGGQGTLVGAAGKPSSEPAAGAVAVAGGLVPGANAARAAAREILQVETRGPFSYDAEKNLARFDVLPQADPNLPNDVRVTKVPPRPGMPSLFSQVLEIEFNGSPTGNPPPSVPASLASADTPPAGPRFRKLHAWTYTPGRFLTVSSDADHLEAYGQDLVHEQAAEKTTLTGGPLYAVQERNVLTAGGAKNPAVLVIEPAPSVPGASGVPPRDRRNQATVNGPGRFEMYDAVAKANTTTATWRKSMVHTKERINDRDVDLFTLTDAARFEDTRADYWLKGSVLKLWLKPGRDAPSPAGDGNSRALPHRIQAIGDVSGHSADMDIEQTDQLIAYFTDIAPPGQAAGPVEPMAPVAPGGAGPRNPPEPKAAPAPPEPAKPAKPPMKLKARMIDTWVERYPLPNAPATPMAVAAAPNEAANGGMKYQLRKAKCEGMVSVHQDPEDPTKPRGTDILGSLMLIDSTPDGSILNVFGWDNRPGEVHNEGTSLIGAEIIVDQLHNEAVIKGRGSVVIPSSTGLTGTEPKTNEPVVIHFRDGMTFRGALKIAEFFGKVNASQASSWVTCHTMRVNFDRPVYFTQTNRPKAPPKGPNAPDDKPKLDIVDCYSAPGDTADSPQEKIVTFTQVERDPQTGSAIRRQQIEALELRLEALAVEPEGGEPYRRVTAEGPGIVRTWAAGSRDDAPGPTSVAMRPAGRQTTPTATAEMKLTVVNFSDRMIAKDKGDRYKEATFRNEVQVIHVPTDDPNLDVKRNQLPPRAVLLTCSNKLVVWTRKVDNEPAQQSMHAYGNAYLQNEEYEGWGEVIQSEGRLVRLYGMKDNLARIKSRFGGTEQPGEVITYDRATDYYKVDGSIGGSLTTPGGKSNPKGPNRPTPKK